MIGQSIHSSKNRRRFQKVAALLVFILCAGLFTANEAQAQGACTGSLPAIIGFELVGCTEFKPANSSSAAITAPGAVQTNDLLIAVVQIDDGNNNANGFSMSSGYWTQRGSTLQVGGFDSAVYSRLVAAPGEAGTSVTFSWAGGNERFNAFILQFRGSLDFDPQAISQATGNSSGGGNPAPTPNLNPSAGFPAVNNAYILRTLSADRNRITVNDAGMAGNATITMDRTGNGGGSVSGGAAGAFQTVAGDTGTPSFDMTQTEGYHTRTLSIQPYVEFRFVTEEGDNLDGTASQCGIELITLQATSRDGTVLPWYTGTVNISATNSASAIWTNSEGLSGTFSPSAPVTGGSFSYTFDGSESGEATFQYFNPIGGGAVVEFTASDSTGTYGESSTYGDPSLTILDCEFVVTNEAGNQVETCALEEVTISLQDTAGNPATNYSGTLTIDNGSGSSFGNYSLVSGSFVLDNATADDGIATYPFVITPSTPGTPHQLVVDYIHGSTSTTAIDLALTEDSGLAIPEAAGNLPLTVAPCEIIATLPDGDTTRDVCSLTRVTFEIQAGGSPVINFSGVIDLSTSATQGLWFENPLETYPGSLTGGGLGDGTASYDFNGTEGGEITFDFRNQVTATNLSFLVSGITDEGITLVQGGAAPVITDIAQCTLTITTANATVGNIADVCRPNEAVTYKLTNRDGGDATGFNGTVVMQTNTAKGNYALTAGSGTLTSPGGNEGFATYAFDPGDNGEFTVNFSVLAKPAGPGTITLTASLSGAILVNTDGTFTYRACVFNISFPSDTAPFETDVCSIKQVRIDLVDFDGDPVTDYTGTINLSTSSGFGSWTADVSANGTLNDPFGEDGAASYTFVDTNPGTDPGDDDGVLLLNFTHTAAAAPALNINVSDSVTSDPGNPGTTNDPNLAIDLCTFQISFDGGTTHDNAEINACTVQAVTIEVYDSTGSIATDYAGQINLSTSTNNGNWAINSGNGSLSGAVVDGGQVSYTFNDDGIGLDDNGVVTLDFSDLNAETVNINIVDEVIALALDGVMVEEGAADPNLEIGSCIPSIAQRVCSVGGSPLTISLPITAQAVDPGLRGRMVAVATVHEGTAVVNNVSFDGALFDDPGEAQLLKDIRVDEAGTTDNYASLWAMNEAQLPTAANNYDVVVTHTDTSLAACAFFLTDVDQTFPTEDLVTPSEGQMNATSSAVDNVTVASTTITTTENNALIISIVGIGEPADTDDVSPDPPMVNFNPQPSDPAGAGFGGASGNASSAAAITIEQDMDINTTFRHTHIVASFNPLIEGPPVADGYEPVVLFKTYSGNMSYRAVGASFLTGPNGNNVCGVVGSNTASTTLTLPDSPDGVMSASGDVFSAAGEFDSDVRAAWLYWFASGSYDMPNISGTAIPNTNVVPANFDNVTFATPDGSGGTNTTNITADEVFIIEDSGSLGQNDFYVGYKDVTGLMAGTENEGTGSDESPNGTYTLSNIEIDDGQPWLGRGACAGGFALVVIYENDYEQLRVINLFHGFQPFQNSNFTLVPRNFRMAERDTNTQRPNGQVTHITVEGDASLAGANEGLTLQETPNDFDPNDFNALITDYNPATEEFNGTITRPIYTLQDPDVAGTGAPEEYFYLFQPNAPEGDNPTTGNPSNGYELDFPNPDFFDGTYDPPGAPRTRYGASWGVDVDTHFIDGDEIGDLLYEFADPLNPTEEITTRYAADQDLVLLVAEIISVTNADIADIEVTVSEADLQYKVNSTGTFNIEVKNNGSGATNYGTATGYLEVVGELPPGMTFVGGAAVSGSGWTCSENATAFTCFVDLPGPFPAGLGATPLPLITATVTIAGPPANFPSLNNDAKFIVRAQHSDGTCLGGSTGVLPTPTDSCRPPEFDNVNFLESGAIDINDLEDKTAGNNNVHSITTNVKGIETDLAITKAVTTVLEEGTTNSVLYTIVVTNNGPDDIVGSLTQPAITVTDFEPVGINIDSASGTNWDCTVNTVPNPDQLVCTFDILGVGSIASGANSVITVVGDVTGSSPNSVTNTVQVAAGTYNFDNVPGNNTFGTTDNITAEPAAVTDRFLLSVSAAAAANTTSLGSGGGLLSDFSDDDIVLYDPQTDSAELFIDSATTPSYSVSDPNAIHLLPNGQVVLSSNEDGNSIGTNNQAFDKDDIVLYDKLLNTATLLFDGSALITDDGGDSIDLNIDSVYVLNDGKIIFSTAGPASDGGAVSWSDSDLVLYDPVGGTFSIYLDAEDDNVFDAVDAQVDALYLRVDPADATMVLDTFVVSSEVQGAVLGDDNVIVGRDDIAEITIDGGSRPTPTSTTSSNLFNGGIPIGVFDTMEPDLKLNALHLIEPAHLGHFEIAEVVQGDACTPARIRIRKHLGTSHATDTAYTGSIVISTDSMPENGVWVLFSGEGTLDNSYGGSSDNGQALYTFSDDGPGGSADDDGEVILTLDVTESTPVIDSVNVSVTNGFVVDGDTGDNPFEFNLVSTDVDYRDNFSVAAYTNSDGSAGWANDWTEVDGFNGVSPASGAGLATGNIRMTGGKLTLTSNSNTEASAINPSMARAAGLGFFDYTEPVRVKFNYGYQSVTSSGDEVELQISNDGSSYITVKTYDSLDGTSISDVVESVDLSANLISAGVPGPTEVLIDGANPNLYVRLAVTEGYVLGTFTVDNFQVTTSTTSCNTAGLVHYHIDIPATGLACVTSNVTITGHDFGHNPVPIPGGTLLNLTTSNGSGSWVNTVGGGTLIDTGTITDGIGTYELTGGPETSIQLQFNYTDPAGDGAAVGINVSDGALTEVFDGAHDPTSTFSEAGLVFYDQDAGNLSTTLPFQIGGKPSLTAPASGNVTLQIVRSVPIPGENAAAACESLVDDGDIVTVTFAGLCVDPAGCDAGASSMTIFDAGAVAQAVPVFSSPTANPEQQVTATDLTVQFSDLGLVIDGEQNIGAPLNFIYPNSGQISLHAEYEIPLDNDTAGTLSGDTINGASETFVVRPFGFDIDFGVAGDDRSSNGPAPFAGSLSYATDENGPAFARAGVGFDATVSAVLWEQVDDVNSDGIPDPGADLSNNAVATNFGDEAVDNNTVVVSVRTDNPGVPGGVNGAMVTVDGSSDVFQAFTEGVSGPQNIAINEVGIFNLAAELVDNNVDRNPINYFETTPYTAVEGVVGGVGNVGRIYPNNFKLISSSFGPRTNQLMACAMTSPFTYMGEDFGINFELEARNFQDVRTQNYFDDYAKLTDFSELDIRAIVDVASAADTDLTSRLVNSTVPVLFDKAQVVKWVAGAITLSGDMNIARLVSGEDAPLTNVKIAFGPLDDNDDGIYDGGMGVGADNDVLLDVFDVDLDDGAPDVDPGVGPWQFKAIGTHEFRYGRLLVENAYGSELEDLEIGIVIEYFDGTDFVVNTADNCTALEYTVADSQLDFVAGSFESDDVGNPFEAGDSIIENGVDATLTIFEGRTGRMADGDSDSSNDPDRPFFITAPDNEQSGRVLIELDLDPNDDNSPTSLHFLEYDWRGGVGEDPGDEFDEVPEGANYEDNPRGVIEFGSYRGHDRVINWQEIYIGPGL